MKASEYAPKFQSIFDQAEAIEKEVAAKEYTSWDEAKRDRARVLDLYQQYTDLLGEAANDPEALKSDKLDGEYLL